MYSPTKFNFCGRKIVSSRRNMPSSPRRSRTGRRTLTKDRLQINAGKRYTPSLPRSSRTANQTERNVFSTRRDLVQVSHDRRSTPSSLQRSRSDRRSDRDSCLQRKDKQTDHRFEIDARNPPLDSGSLLPPWNNRRLDASPPRRYHITDESLPPKKYFEYSPLPPKRIRNDRQYTKESSPSVKIQINRKERQYTKEPYSSVEIHVDQYLSPRRNHTNRNSSSKRDQVDWRSPFKGDIVKRSPRIKYDRFARDTSYSPQKDYNDEQANTRSLFLSKMNSSKYSKNTYAPLRRSPRDRYSKDHLRRENFNGCPKVNTTPRNREDYDRPSCRRDNGRSNFRSRSNPRRSPRSSSPPRNNDRFDRNNSSSSQRVNSKGFSWNDHSSLRNSPRKSLKTSPPQKYRSPSPNRYIYLEKDSSLSRREKNAPEDHHRRLNDSTINRSYLHDDGLLASRAKHVDKRSSNESLIQRREYSNKYYTCSNLSPIRKSISVFPNNRSNHSPRRDRWSSNQGRTDSSIRSKSSHHVPSSPIRTQKSAMRYH